MALNLSDFPMTDPVNRLGGGIPKVGIRPTIDGRMNGVREGLEEQTMGMARAAAQLIESKLRHPNGLPVQCVIADSTIGGAAEAVACAEKFARQGVGVTLTVTPCWCYGSETMDMDPATPKAIWGFNGTERPGAVYLAAVLAAHSQKGIPAFGIYGHDVQDASDGSIPADVQEKILAFVNAGLAVAWMRGSSYLSMGGTAMGIAGSIPNPTLFEDYLGMRFESIDMTEFTRRIDLGIYDPEAYDRAYAWVKRNCLPGWDKNPADKQHDDARKEEVWQRVVKMALIAKDLMVGNPRLRALGFGEEANGHNAIAAGFQGQRQWTDYFPNGDFMEAMLNASFDWDGIREPYIVATENDALNGVCMLFGHLLTGGASVFADVRTYWSPEAVKRVTGYALEGRAKDGFIHLINSGAAAVDGCGRQQGEDGQPTMKPFWQITPQEAADCMEATCWPYADLGYFRGGGYSSKFVTKAGMPVTLTRLNWIKGVGPVMQIAEGYTVELPEEVFNTLDMRTDPTWPTTLFAPILTGKDAFTDVYSVMNNWGANHGAFNAGHVGDRIITLCAMLRIPVCMHNVDESRLFRPSSWNAFGTKDREGADFRACANFGPLYGRK
jgi:L-fucose isomerase